jgi:di/tricarboxylate transporter
MTADQIALFAILGVLFALLAWGRWRYDVVAFAALLAAVVAGVVPAERAFAGFGHPATITVAAILILSRSLTATGATDWIARAVQPAAATTASHIGVLSSLAAAMSAFMNNVGTLGLMMPVALQSARKAKRSPAVVLMPLSFGAILGGLVTLIGTPPNIIVATYRTEVMGAPFGMFDFTPVGAVTALAGVAFVALVGWRLVPAAARERAVSPELFDIEHYVAEARVPKGSTSVGKTLAELDAETKEIDALPVALLRGARRYPPSAGVPVQAGDMLVVEGSPEELDKLANALKLKLGSDKGKDKTPLGDAGGTLVEAVIAPRARLEGQTVATQRLIGRHGFTLLAVARQGRPYRGRLKAFRFRIGDVLLLHGEAERVPDALAAFGCLPLAARGLSVGQRAKAPYLIAIFAAAIAAASFGLLSIPIALSLAVAATVLFGLLPVRELYEGVDWPVIVLLGALIPVGGALEKTGATEVIAGLIHQVAAGQSAVLVLVLLMVVTMTLSDILNNAATAVVMAPIGVGIAERLGTSPDPFLMAVAIGASCAFLTPIGHQNNALIMGPGGYRFWDYWRLGLPLEALIVAVATPMILWVWPL